MRTAQELTTLAVMCVLVFTSLPGSFAQAAVERINICKYENGAYSPKELNREAASGWILSHGHDLDIIPPFTEGLVVYQRNWDDAGMGIYNNGLCNGAATTIPDVNLSITKELVGPMNREVGDAVVFKITIENGGSDDATGVVISDPLTAGLEYLLSAPIVPEDTEASTLLWDIGTLVAGGSITTDLTVTIGEALASSSFSNTALLDSNETDPVSDTSDTVLVEGEKSSPQGEGGSGERTTLTIIKRVVNGPVTASADMSASDFTLNVSHAGGDVAVSGSETGETIDIEPGAYSVSEGSYAGYSSTSVSESCSGSIAAGESRVCTVTNEQDRYHIIGTVWNDTNVNGVIDSGESVNAGWIIHARQGDDDITTVSDANGAYVLDVPRGHWTVSPEYPEGWGSAHETQIPVTYTLPDDLTERSEDVAISASWSFLSRLWRFLVPTAHAALMGTIEGVNFGTKVVGGGESTGGDGNGIHISLTATEDSAVASEPDTESAIMLTDTRQGLVLGEATSVLPLGAPNTGGGGAAGSDAASLSSLIGMLVSLLTLRILKNG